MLLEKKFFLGLLLKGDDKGEKGKKRYLLRKKIEV